MKIYPSRFWKDTAGLAALPLTVAALGLALACAGTGAARPQVDGPAPQVAPSAQAAGAVAPSGSVPSVQVVGGESFSFGAFWPGETLKHTFILKNAGGAQLKILRVQPG